MCVHLSLCMCVHVFIEVSTGHLAQMFSILPFETGTLNLELPSSARLTASKTPGNPPPLPPQH